MIHQRIDHTPNNNQLKPKVALATMLALGLAGCGNERPASSTPTERPTNSSSPSTGNETITPTPTEAPSPTDLPTSLPSPENGIVGSPELYAAMEKMDPEQFAKYPVEARTDYLLTKYFGLSENGSLPDAVDQELTNGKFLYDYNPYQHPLDLNSGGDEIILGGAYAEQVVKAWKQGNINSVGEGLLDHDMAKKLISGVAYDSKSPAYKTFLETLETVTKTIRIKPETLNGTIAHKTSQIKKVEQDDGTTISQRTIDVISGGNTVIETYNFVPKDEALGEGKGLWLLVERRLVR